MPAPSRRAVELGGRRPPNPQDISLRSITALAALALHGCGSPPPAGEPRATASAAERARSKAPAVGMVTPSRVLPDLRIDRNVVAAREGHRRVLVDRMRVIVREDGTLERAAELLPVVASWVELPSRLGGGYLFFSANDSFGGATQMWRASSWLAKLDPLVQFSQKATRVVPGFDRIYVQLSTGKPPWIAIDLESGERRPLEPLPPAAGYGEMAFADGWRAVVDTDLRGPLATFDAGLTWRAIGVKERITAIPIIDGHPTLVVNGGQHTVDARGMLTFRADAPPESATDEEDPEDERSRPAGPFGRRPLRAAVEDGWPDSATTAVVARGGALGRVSLHDGAIMATTENAYPDRLAACHAIRVAGPAGFGFLCGERDGPTSVYAFVPPLGMTPLMRFARPRFVAPSGNGALVIRGTCSDAPAVLGDARAYCVRGVDGATREIRVKGELGAERVVALADGRVGVVVPPRPGAEAQLTLLKGTALTSVALKLPTEPRAVAKEVRRGMWLDGFEEREPGVISGWVEAGGPVVGLKITLDGKVKTGELRDDAGGAVLSGRFGLTRGDGGSAAETTDGGMTWRDFSLPETKEDPDDSPSRGCGAAGCVLSGWIRVGWGSPEVKDDLAHAQAPPPLSLTVKQSSSLRLGCVEAGQVTPPLPPEKPKPAPAPPPRPPVGPSLRFPSSGSLILTTPTLWQPFRNTAPPARGADEIGFDSGSSSQVANDAAAAWVYAWGRKGADWTRAGRWLVRFDDRFDPGGGVRSSAISPSPWADESAAAEAVGRAGHGNTQWGGLLDPSGRATLLHSCRGGGSACSLFAVAAGQPPLPLRDEAGRTPVFLKPSGAVRVGETWFFLTQAIPEGHTLWRADLGVARSLRTFLRPKGATLEAPRLVRRALGGAIGLMVTGSPDPGIRAGSVYVYPIDAESGELTDAIALGRKDEIAASVERCGPHQDGWHLDTQIGESPPVVLLQDGEAKLDGAELRLRVDPGTACVDGLAARMDGTFTKRAASKTDPAPSPKDESRRFTLTATERSGRRWIFKCDKRAL